MLTMRRRAFTLVESVIGLLVISMIMISCWLLTNTGVNISKQQIDQPVSWYQFLNKLEDDGWSFSIERVERSGRRMRLTSQSKDETYQLLVSNSGMIYLRKMKPSGGGKGYLPLYGPISNNGLKIEQLDEQRVRIEVKRHDEKTRVATLCFLPSIK